MSCPICNRPRSARYANEARGEACVDPCHWPYLSSVEVAKASRLLDRIRELGASPRTRNGAELHALCFERARVRLAARSEA